MADFYKNGKIYKIVSYHTDNIYIGSTCNPLSKRIYDHKNSYKSYVTGIGGCLTSFDLIKLGNVDIILIENYPCNDKNELRSRERYWIEQNKAICVNIVIPTRTGKEYYNDNKDSKKQYYIYNKGKISARQKEYYYDNRDKLKQLYQDKLKQLYQDNKEEAGKEKINCGICNSTVRKSNFKKHTRSQKHIKALAVEVE